MSASDAITGRLPWADLDHLVRVLLADRSSRLCAEVNGWPARVDRDWLLSALLESTGATVNWPWLQAANEPDPDELDRARQSLMDRWGA